MACRPLDTIATRSLGANGTGGDLSLIRSCRPLRDHPGRAELEVILSLIRSCQMPRGHPGERFIPGIRSEEHTSELQSLMRISYAVFCLKKKKQTKNAKIHTSIIQPPSSK